MVQQRNPLRKRKENVLNGKKIFSNNMTNKGLTSKIHERLIQFNIRKKAQLKNGQKT